MAKAHMTKLYWYETEMNKLVALGYAEGEAHRKCMDYLLDMDLIEWATPEEVQNV